MSVSASIDIQLQGATSCELLQLFLDFGWSTDDHDGKTYLPIADKDFDWVHEKISEQQLFLIVQEKMQRGELIGVSLIWKQTNIGGDFLLYPDGMISVSISINRKVANFGMTDVNWYLERLLPAIARNQNITIASVWFSESA